MSAAASPRTSGDQKRHLSVFVLIDALGWKYLEGRDFLNEELPYRQPLRTVLGFSSGAIPTILTGVFPSQHGHWNLFYYDPKNSPFHWLRYFRFLPDRLLDSRVPRKLVKELGRRLLGMGPLFECAVSPRLMPYFNWVEKRNIYDRGGITGAPSIFDELSKAAIPYRVYSYHHHTDNEIIELAKSDIRAGEARFLFLYLSEMDMFLHMNCTSPQKIEERLRWYDSRLREVFCEARAADPNCQIALSSDHGMTPVTAHFDLVREISALNLAMPADYLSVYDSTMARFWYFSAEARQRIESCLAGLSCGRIISDQEQKQFGIFFPDRRFGETIFLLNPGTIIAQSDFNGAGWRPVGMHGYHPDDSFSDGVFLSSSQPGFELRSIADVHRYLADSTGLQAPQRAAPSISGEETVAVPVREGAAR